MGGQISSLSFHTTESTSGTYRELVAQSLVLLPVALRDGDGPVVVLVVKRVVRHVPHPAQAAAAVEVVLEVRLDARPHLDARAVAGVAHGDVVDVQILDNVGLALVLAEGADADAVGAVADEVLDDDICAVRLEGNAVWGEVSVGRRVCLGEGDCTIGVVNVRILDDDAVGAIRIPAV